ncbi:MAG: metalloregulator ArsR/SmtB family transcription factor [Pseudomonadales bacterium]|nr:metalloregulator ArsR/SmtB family transcription factor [Pseudomonadales bacterium]
MTIFNPTSLNSTFHALSNASRREILRSIRENHQCTAGELVQLFDSSQPTISKHLKVLEQAKLVERKIEGRLHYFTLSVEGITEAEQWISRHLEFWNHSLDRLDKFLDEG